ncbi:2OG-Fe(II) oxygenase [Flavivirga aquatica]|uniref:2OG-Fe(II) oxygenase n=1 Tax=Flavivirga aquatica TaxID=1849968 RepID=UPI00196AE3D6
MEEQSKNKYETLYLNKIWWFINHLNKTCFTSIKTFESHYANYEQGSFYKRHLDQFKNEKGRKYSIVLYLNQNWKDEDDGKLSLYPLNRAQKNISPLEGRMVFFRSDKMEHEVHPSLTRERRSIAGWLKN